MRTLFRLCGVVGGGLLLASLSGATACAAAASAPKSRPNIILILADDLGYEGLSCYGSASGQTPRLDRLAAQGLQFTHCYAQPLCTPSRLQLMTGSYNVRNYTQFGDMLPNEKTFGNYLRERGYATCIAGKWQLGGDRHTIAEFGFDLHLLWWLEKRTQRYRNVGDLIQDRAVRPGKPGEYGPDVVNDYVLEFITQQTKQGQPFFCYYPMMLPHAPMSPTPKSDRAKVEASAPMPKAPKAADGDAAADDGEKGGDPRYFPDMVNYMDGLVGRVVDRLDELGIRENTLLIFTGDNGTNTRVTTRMKDGSLIHGGKGRTTDAGTRVPLLISWPGVVQPGRVEDSLVDFTDFLPTLCQIAGYASSEIPKGDGISLLPLLRGDRTAARDWSYCWYSSDGTPAKARKYARTLRYKLYADGRFFDLAHDSLEKNPLPAAQITAALRPIHTRLKTILDRYDAIEAKR